MPHLLGPDRRELPCPRFPLGHALLAVFVCWVPDSSRFS